MFLELLRQRRNPELHLVRRRFARTLFSRSALLFLFFGMGLNILRSLAANNTNLQVGILGNFLSYIAALSVDFFMLFLVIILNRFFTAQRTELFSQLHLAGISPVIQLTALFDLVLALMLLDVLVESLLLLFIDGPLISRAAEYLTTVLFALPFAFFFSSLVLYFNLRRMLILWQILIPAAIFAATMLLIDAMSGYLVPLCTDLMETAPARRALAYFDPASVLARGPNWMAIIVLSWITACAVMLPIAAIAATFTSSLLKRHAARLVE